MTTFALEASEGLRRLAEPRLVDDKVKAAIGRAARRAGLTYTRAFDLWYKKARRIDAAELEAIRNAAQVQKLGAADEFMRLVNQFADITQQAASMAPFKDSKHAAEMQRLAGKARTLVSERFER